MSRRSRRRLALGGALLGAAVCAVFVYVLLWGKLFPYSAIVTGFDRTELPHVVLYLEKAAGDGAVQSASSVPGADLAPRGLHWVDRLAPEVEATHTLKFKSKPRLLFFADSATYARRTTTRARLCTYYNGSIVVSPWVQREDAEGVLSLDVYLRHELSHALLYQNMGLLSG